MAKVEGFKNKITKAQEDLFKALEAEKEKKKALSDKIVQELSKQEKANVKTLNSLNKEYLEECANNEKQLQLFIEEIQKLNEDLISQKETFKQHYQEYDGLTVLKEKNETNVVTAKNKFKREIQDINIKIDRIDRELKEILETRINTYDDECNNFKNKVIEYDKRKKFDISKIQTNTIKEYDNLQKLLLKENKKSEIKNINKKIKQIRYAGLIEEKECLFRYLAEQRQYELDFAKYEYEYKCENSKLQLEYSTKIEDTKFDRSMIEFNYKKNCDKNENDLIHTFNENDKKYKLDYNNDLKSLYSVINDKTVNQYNYEKETSAKETELVKRIYQDIEDNDTKQAEKLFELSNKELALINKDTLLFKKNIITTVTFYIQNIVTTYNHYYKSYLKKEEAYVNSLIINCMKGNFLQGYDYSEYIDKVKDIFNKFIENEENYINSFNEYLHNVLSDLLTNIETFANQIYELNDIINKTFIDYHQSINSILIDAKINGSNYIDEINSKKNTDINISEENNKLLYEKRLAEIEETNNEYNEEFVDRESKVKQVEAEQNAQYDIEYAEIDKNKNNIKTDINNKYNEEITQFLTDYNNKIQTINTKYDEENKKVEHQYKVKMGLL